MSDVIILQLKDKEEFELTSLFINFMQDELKKFNIFSDSVLTFNIYDSKCLIGLSMSMNINGNLFSDVRLSISTDVEHSSSLRFNVDKHALISIFPYMAPDTELEIMNVNNKSGIADLVIEGFVVPIFAVGGPDDLTEYSEIKIGGLNSVINVDLKKGYVNFVCNDYMMHMSCNSDKYVEEFRMIHAIVNRVYEDCKELFIERLKNG